MLDKYEIVIDFHLVDDTGLQSVTYKIKASSWESAFKCALTMKDTDFPNQKLKNINVYNVE